MSWGLVLIGLDMTVLPDVARSPERDEGSGYTIRIKSRTTGVSPWGKTLVFEDQRKP